MTDDAEVDHDEVEKILRLGRENPLSYDEALRLMTTIVIRLQESACKRGRPVAGLDGDPRVIAAQIVERRKKEGK